MTTVAKRDENIVATTTPQTAEKLIAWAQAAQAAHQLATSLVQTAFVPEHYRGKPAEATAAILAGAELGFDPMASLRTFDNIKGTAAPKAITLRAVAQSHGHEINVTHESDTKVAVEFRRKGSDAWNEVEWTIERAERMGLPAKNPNWKSNPRAMLVARATAEAARRVASDAILGIPYSAEELRDQDPPVQATSARVTAAEILGKRQQPDVAPEVSTGQSGSAQPDPPGDDGWPTVIGAGGKTS